MKMTKARQSWLDHIKQWEGSKLSMSDYAKQHNLNVQKFYQFKSTFRKEGMFGDGSVSSNLGKSEPAGFTRVKVEQPAVATQSLSDCEVTFKNDLVLRFNANLSSAQIRHVVTAVVSVNL